MGVFDVLCAASGIVLDGRTRLLLAIEAEDGGLEPCLPPLSGTYDRYGKIENVAPGPVRDAALALAKKLEHDELEELFDAAFDGEASVRQGKLRYALIDEIVYRASVATVASGALSTVPVDLEATLDALDFEALVTRAVAIPELALPLLRPFAKDEVMRHELSALALFRQMPLALAATTPDSPSDQYLCFHEALAKKDGLPAAETETRAAQRRFADYPLILAAIAENERVWIERERQNVEGDEDDDDSESTYTVSLEPPDGHAVPQLLADFAAWLEDKPYGAVGYFELLVEAAPSEWDPKLARRLSELLSFLTLPDGSLLVLAPNPPHSSPVALLGSEGELRTVATSLEAFLLALAGGKTGIMELDEDDATERDALGDFLKSKKVQAPRAPAFDFEAWLRGSKPEKSKRGRRKK